MHTAVQPGGVPGRSLTASGPSQQLKTDVSQNVGASTPNKSKKRERTDSNSESSKRERSLNPEEGDSSSTKVDHAIRSDEAANFEDGGLSNAASVEKLVSVMQQDRNDGVRKPADMASRRTVLAAAIAATENHECLDRFVQLGGVRLLDEWLQEAHKGKCGDGESPKDANKGVEELLLTIMSALEKLPVDLVALKTCQVGKSVNNHRSHKNVEIKEKARKLVDTWKKRVDEEVNSTGDIKTGLNHVNSWSSKSLPLNMCTSDTAGQQAAGAKASNGLASGASTTKFKASSNNKDEKGSGASQSPNNGQLWNNHVAGALTWKDEVKSSTSPSSGTKSNNPNYRASNLHGKGLSGLNPTATQKESTMGKPLVWSRSGVNEKGADALVTESSPQKLILRLPNPGRSASASVSVNGEAFGPGSQGSSPNLPEQTSASSIVDASDIRHKVQVSGGKCPLPSDVSTEQHQTDGVANLKDEPLKEDEPSKEDEPEKKQSTVEGNNKSEVSRMSDANDKGNTMAIVPISAASRISGGERDAGVSGRSVIMSEAGTVDQEIARSAIEPETAEADARSECKEEARRKDTQDGVDGANCASSSSFTEMSVAGQGGNPDHKNQRDESRETISSNNADESAIVGRPRLEQEGLGESPELRSCTSQALKRSESSAGDFSAALKHGADQSSGDAYPSDKRGVTISADVSSTQGPKIAPFGGRGSYEGLGRRLERYENSWEEKRNSYPFEKGGRQHCKNLAFDCKSSSEGGSRKTGAEQESGSKVEEIKRMDSTSDFVEDDALEVAQQIAKEVEQEMESYCKPPSHLSSVKDGRDTNSVKMHHLSTKEADSSSRQLSDKCSPSVEKQENGDQLLRDCKGINRASSNADSVAVQSQAVETEPVQEDKKTCELESEKVPGSPVKASEGYAHVGSEKANHCQIPTVLSSKADEPVKQEKSIEEFARPDFDLNEGLAGEEGLKEAGSVLISNPVASVAGPTAPIAVLPTTKGAFIPPERLMKVKAEPGWKGSAATSAFRPAEPRRVHEAQPSFGDGKDPGLAQSGKVVRPPLDIDLNVADEKDFSDAGFEGQGLNSFPSRPFSERQVAVSSSQASGRVAFDLNCADECEDGTGLDVKVGLSRKDTQGNGRIAKGVTRDFDLNGPMVDDAAGEEPVVQHLSLRSSENSIGSSVPGFRMGGDLVGVAPWFPPGNSFSAVAIPAFPMARAESTYSVPAQPFLNGGIHFNVDLYRGGMTLATPAVAYPTNPPVAYPYAGFPFASNYSFNSSASFPAGSTSYVDASGSTSYPAVSSQIGGGQGVMSRFIRPHLMGITETARADGSNAWVRPSLDLNTGPEASESDVRVDLRPPSGPMNGRGVPLEDHLRGFNQVAPTVKRKEPESGWEAFQAGYKQPTWC